MSDQDLIVQLKADLAAAREELKANIETRRSVERTNVNLEGELKTWLHVHGKTLKDLAAAREEIASERHRHGDTIAVANDAIRDRDAAREEVEQTKNAYNEMVVERDAAREEVAKTQRQLADQAATTEQVSEKLASALMALAIAGAEVQRLSALAKWWEEQAVLITESFSKVKLVRERDAAREDSTRLVDALTTLVSRLDAVHADPRYIAVWFSYQIHGGQYTDPTYHDELKAARAALAARGKEREG